MINFYELLGVEPNATDDQINKAFKIKAKQSHPDVNNGAQVAHDYFLLITTAKDTLLDPEKRLEHDFRAGIKKRPEVKNVKPNNSGMPEFAAGALLTLGLVALLSSTKTK